jgi:uncharacterized membrane protein YidH (DUF202 family)
MHGFMFRAGMDIGTLAASVFIVFCGVAVCSVGFVIWQRRVWSSVTGSSTPLAVLTLLGTGVSLLVSTLATAANIALAAHLLDSKVSTNTSTCTALGALLLAVRMLYWVVSSVYTYVNTSNHRKLLVASAPVSVLDPAILLVGLLLFFGAEATKLLPWLRTNMTDVSGGYATAAMMTTCTMSNLALAVCVFILSLAAVGQENRNHDTKTMAAVSVVFSGILLLVTAIAAFQARLLVSGSKLNDSLTNGGSIMDGNNGTSDSGTRADSTFAESIIVKEAMNSTFQPPIPSLAASTPPPTATSSRVHTQANPIHRAASKGSLSTGSGKSYELSVNANSVRSGRSASNDNAEAGGVVNQIITDVLRAGPSSSASSSGNN